MKEVYKQCWLAEATKIDENGTVWSVILEDGAHDSPCGVKEAQTIIQGIGLDKIKGRNRRYVMVTIEEVPDIKVEVNTEAIKCCKEMVDNRPKLTPSYDKEMASLGFAGTPKYFF